MNKTTEMVIGVVLATLLALMASILWITQGGEIRQWIAIMATILASAGWIMFGIMKVQHMLDCKEVKEKVSKVSKVRKRHFECKKCGNTYLSVEERYLRENPLAAEDFLWEKREEHRDWCPKEIEVTEAN